MAVEMSISPAGISYFSYYIYTSQTNGKTRSPEIYPGYSADGSDYDGFIATNPIIYLNDILDLTAEVKVQGYNNDTYSDQNTTCLLPTLEPTAPPFTPTTSPQVLQQNIMHP